MTPFARRFMRAAGCSSMTAIGRNGFSTTRACTCGLGRAESRYDGHHRPGPRCRRGRVLCRLSGWRVSRPPARDALGRRPGDPLAMITVCPGWPVARTGEPDLAVHTAAIVLRDDGVADGRVSHGICPACVAALDRDPDLEVSPSTWFSDWMLRLR